VIQPICTWFKDTVSRRILQNCTTYSYAWYS